MPFNSHLQTECDHDYNQNDDSQDEDEDYDIKPIRNACSFTKQQELGS